ARDLADEQNERGGALPRDMHARRRIGGDWPARDEADAGPPGRLAASFRHDGGPALLPANGDGDIAGVEGIERRDVALPRQPKHVARPVDDELGDQNFGGRPGAVIGAHPASPMALPLAFTPCRKRAPWAKSCNRAKGRRFAATETQRSIKQNGSDHSPARPTPSRRRLDRRHPDAEPLPPPTPAPH